MQSAFWPDWAKILERRGLKSLVCIILDQARPLSLITAQILMLGLPLFNGTSLGGQLSALADMLGDEAKSARFLAYLKEEQA